MSARGVFTAAIGDVDPLRFATQVADLIREVSYGPASMVWRQMPERRRGRFNRYIDDPDWTCLSDYSPSPPTDPERIERILVRQVTGHLETVEAVATRVIQPYSVLAPEILDAARARWIQAFHAHLAACVRRFARQAREWHRRRLQLVEVDVIEEALAELERRLGGASRKRTVHQTEIRRYAHSGGAEIRQMLTRQAPFLAHPDFALVLEATTWTLRRAVLEEFAT